MQKHKLRVHPVTFLYLVLRRMDELESIAKYLLKDVSYAKLHELFTAVRKVNTFGSTA